MQGVSAQDGTGPDWRVNNVTQNTALYDFILYTYTPVTVVNVTPPITKVRTKSGPAQQDGASVQHEEHSARRDVLRGEPARGGRKSGLSSSPYARISGFLNQSQKTVSKKLCAATPSRGTRPHDARHTARSASNCSLGWNPSGTAAIAGRAAVNKGSESAVHAFKRALSRGSIMGSLSAQTRRGSR